MAVDPQIVRQPPESGGDGSLMKVTWVLTTANPDGTPIPIPEFADKNFTIGMEVGDAFGGATCAIQGANTLTATFATLNKAATGTAATAAAAGVLAVIENTLFVKPILTGGAGATVTVILLARRANPMRT